MTKRELMLVLLLLILLVLLTSSCAQQPLTTRVDVVRVPSAPIIEKCIAAKDVPVLPDSRIPESGNIEQLSAGTSASMRRLKDYALKADALLRVCSE